MSPPVQRGLPDIARDVIRGPRRRPQDRPAWRPPWLGRKTITRTFNARGEEVAQRRDYDVPPAPAPITGLPGAPTRSLAEWRTLDRDWAAAERPAPPGGTTR